MRWTTRITTCALALFACAGGDGASESHGDDTAGSVAIAIPDSPSPTTDVAGAAAAPGVGSGDTIVTGIVRETGALPLTQLVIQNTESGGPPVAIRGALEHEIQNLIGAEIRMWGPAAANQPPGPPRAVEVSGYEIVSIGGDRPVVGTLMEQSGAFFLVSGDTLKLGSVPEALRVHVGAKIWVVGPRQDGALSVQSFGVIRSEY